MRHPNTAGFRLALAGAAALSLAACQSESQPKSGEETANQLEQAAEQSDPAAAKVMNERADAIRGMESAGTLDNPEAPAQDVMREAGAAQTGAAAQ
jgi:hypothetical protein